MNKKQLIFILLSIVVGAGIIVAALEFTKKNNEKDTFSNKTTEQKIISKTELANANGIDGKDCYVAVDKTVYLIKDFSLWTNGKHKTSGGQAYCGADMTQVIDQAPHGRSKLDLLIKVGTLQE